MSLPHKILVFDSGVGGLSILREIQSYLPHNRFYYACDNQAFPYGTKAEAELVARVDAVLKTLIATLDPDIVVIACNTASTVALPKIRSHFTKPVVGVVPAIKPASALSKTRVIGLLGTTGTVNRPYTQWLIDEFASDATFVRVGSTELVELAEAKLRGIPPCPDRLAAIIAPIFENPECDTLILACTHFPLLQEDLKAVAPRQIQWVDSGNAIARRVCSFVEADIFDVQAVTVPEFAVWLTEDDDELKPGLTAFGATSIHSTGEIV